MLNIHVENIMLRNPLYIIHKNFLKKEANKILMDSIDKSMEGYPPLVFKGVETIT